MKFDNYDVALITDEKERLYYLGFHSTAGYVVLTEKKKIFVVDGRYLFEVGGEKKRFTQIKDICESYVVSDNIEAGTGNRIPLWLFGFLY